MQWSLIIRYGVGYGLVLSVLFTAATFAGVATSRDFLLDDYPPAIQERYGKPKSARGRRVAGLVGMVVWGACGVPLLTAAMIGLDAALDDGLTFLPAALCAALVFATLTVYDLVVLDWIIFAGSPASKASARPPPNAIRLRPTGRSRVRGWCVSARRENPHTRDEPARHTVVHTRYSTSTVVSL
ncbi:hypothetical protein [Streptomyces lanatus]|uniref:Uncharacterized protein n=1 Tax=Streptomyces lanatus TaxID=66900 RepID=A0ABV1Y2J7_9ACTN|nr:hypothetical protein [Streptomyces lanatus]GHH25029.1 hypothetical protein GCM10018780_76090 [Streptomyces lanatus]